MKITRFIKFLPVVAGLIFLQSCSKNPVTGKRELILMSTEQEIALGKQSHPSIVASMGLYQDANLQNFISEKGMSMAKISQRPDLPYQFNIVDSPVVNAFAVPGGYVYFTRGIMAHFNNEAEFAGVLGHEIGHITARHGAKQYTTQIFTNVGLIAGLIIAPKFAQFAQQAMQGLQLLMLKYSREHESQADEIGVNYSSKIGYDAHQMAGFFGTIKRIQDKSGQVIPSMLSTHPDPGDRFNNVNNMARDYQAANVANYAINRDSYLKMVDGLIYGEDPKQGFVENNMFYHPELRFQFPVPTGWQTQNSPAQFQMAPKDDKSAMIFTLAQGRNLAEAADSLVTQHNLKVLEKTPTVINGNQVIVLISQQLPQQQQGQQQQAQTPANTNQIITYLIQYNGTIFALHGLATQVNFSAALPTFRSVGEGFRAITDQEKIDRKPERIFVKTVPKSGTFADVMTGFGMPNKRIEELGIVNSMKAADPVEKGSLIKIFGK